MIQIECTAHVIFYSYMYVHLHATLHFITLCIIRLALDSRSQTGLSTVTVTAFSLN
jgi:hypothetical protein